MRYAVVYTKERLAVNEFFANELCQRLHADLVDESVGNEYDAYIFRCENFVKRKELEKLQKRVINNAKTGEIANDKYLSYELAKRLKIPFLPYILSQNPSELTYPCVLKSRYGHGGKEVFWAENEREASEILKSELICQQPSKEVGHDVRVYCLGSQILCAMERKNDRDFRSNFTLGGTCQTVEIPDHVKEYVKRILDELKPDLIGIDFIIDGDTYYFNEIEDVVGTRMLYANGIDAVQIFAEYIKNS